MTEWRLADILGVPGVGPVTAFWIEARMAGPRFGWQAMHKDIDFSDATWVLSIGDGVKRSLIRYFIPRVTSALAHEGVKSEIAARAGDQTVTNPDAIEALAWRMADAFIHNVGENIAEYYDTSYEGVSAQEALEKMADELLADVEEEFLSANSLDLAVTADFAQGRFPEINSDEPEPAA